VRATPEESMEILQLVKARSLERKALLDDGDLKQIADSVVSAGVTMGSGRDTT
jgi:hypothetical protein